MKPYLAMIDNDDNPDGKRTDEYGDFLPETLTDARAVTMLSAFPSFLPGRFLHREVLLDEKENHLGCDRFDCGLQSR